MRVTPQQRAWMQRATQILEELVASHPDVPDYTLLLATCYREGSPEERNARRPRAIELLTKLCDKHPQVAQYRYELAETYADFELRDPTIAELPSAEEALKKALAIAAQLADEHPNEPEFVVSYVRIMHRLGVLHNRMSMTPDPILHELHLVDSEKLQRDAVNRQATLVAGFPDVQAYRLGLVKLRENFARWLAGHKAPKEARQQYETAQREIDHPTMTDDDRAVREVRESIRRGLDELSRGIDNTPSAGR
jgi:hypothetical protein